MKAAWMSARRSQRTVRRRIARERGGWFARPPTGGDRGLRALDPLAGDPVADAALPQRPAAALVVLALVCVKFRRTLAWAADCLANGSGVDHLFQLSAVDHDGFGDPRGEGNAVRIADHMAFRTCSAAIRRVDPFVPPQAIKEGAVKRIPDPDPASRRAAAASRSSPSTRTPHAAGAPTAFMSSERTRSPSGLPFPKRDVPTADMPLPR